MLLLIELLIFTLVLCLWWYKNDQRRYSKYPPGPLRFPIIGNLPQLKKHADRIPSFTFQKLADIYGDVMFLKVGQLETVVFSSRESIHEMLTNEKTASRYPYEFIKDRNKHKNLGLIFSHGKTWQNLRRFTMRNLRDFGFGKSSVMDAVINDEIEKFHESLKEDLKSAPSKILHVTDLFSITVVNNLWRLVSGKSYDLKDPKILRWVQLNTEWVNTAAIGADLSDPFPKLRDWFPNAMGRTVQKRANEELYKYGKAILEEQRKSRAREGQEPETFLDLFTEKIESSKNDPDTDFNDEQFVLTIMDLFLGGSETSSNTLNFGILYMLLNPEVQEKVQNEIDHEVPENMPIDSSMKSRLPYTWATVLEMLRCSTVIPLPGARQALEDFYFRSHLIKKGTALIFNLYGLHYNEKLWGDPRNFRPDRFLNSEGTAVDPKMTERIMNFGAGKRYCLGQSLAETTMFLYLASTLRKFKFVKVPGTNPTPEPVIGLTFSPQPYDVCILERSRFS